MPSGDPRRPHEVPPPDLTALVRELRTGPDAASRVFPILYDELRRIARGVRHRGGATRTLDTTGLVHEAYLRLVDAAEVPWEDRARFLALAATAMRRIVIDAARRRRAAKRGGERVRVDLEAVQLSAGESSEALLALDDALERLAALNPRLAEVVECRFFAGMSETEIAAAFGVTERTVRRDWVKAKGWLAAAMGS